MKPILLILSFFACLIWVGCQAQAESQRRDMKKSPLSGAGDLLVDGKQPLPLKHTEVKINVIGLVASVKVEQVFTNPQDERIEAIYTFPLPADSAVVDMTMKIGERTIRSLVKRREEAQRIYQQAKAGGQRAGLIEQERPNIFTTSVANINPGDEVRIQIRYLQRLPYDDGGFTLRFPMVVAPRFIPGEPTGKQAAGSVPDTTTVPDASRITPPVLKPETRPGYDITLSVDIETGLPIRHLQCASHQISMSELGPSRTHVELARRDEIPNKDFVLEYKLAGDETKATILTSRTKDGPGYFMLMAVPPIDYVISDIQPKGITFIIDTSGSMTGTKIAQAKNALRALVHGLNPQDGFNIIRFSSDFSSFSPRPVPFTQENVDRADEYIDGLRAAGGTMMLPPLLSALKQSNEEGRLPLIVFLTDGQVGNEVQILKAIQAHLGHARLYTFGVDTAPNDYLLRKMAELGRGTVEFVLPRQNLEEVIARFQNRIASPVLTDVSIDWKGLAVDGVYPSPVPDLFLARPVVLFGRVSRPGKRTVTLRGQSMAGPVTVPLRVDFNRSTADAGTLSALWARARIEALADRLIENQDDEATKQEIIQLALNHKLMSPFTSFVAVEERVVPSAGGGPPKTVVVPVPLPEGWDYDAVFGSPRRGPVGGPVALSMASVSARLSATPSAVPGGVPGGAARGVPGGVVGGMAGGVISKSGRNVVISGATGRELVVPLATREDRTRAVARYLMRQQRVDGVWTDAGKKSATANEIQTTAIALLAYIGHGHTDRAGYYHAQVRRALGRLIGLIDSSGMLRGLQGSEEEVKTQALALWALGEASAATGSSRYRDAAANVAAALLKLRVADGLWPARVGGPPDASTTVWAVLALRSVERLSTHPEVLPPKIIARAARAIKSLSPSSSVEGNLVQFLAGQPVSPATRRALTAELATRSYKIEKVKQAELATLSLILARSLGHQALAQVDAAVLHAISENQLAQGKEAGGFKSDEAHPVTASAWAYLLLGVGEARLAALQ